MRFITKYGKKKKLLALVVVFFIAVYWIKLQVTEVKLNEYYMSILPPKVIDQRIGITDELVATLKRKQSSIWKYQASCNLHIWYELCGQKIESLLTYPIFPHLPSAKHTIKKLQLDSLERNAGFRLYGFLVVSESNEYQFQINSKQTSILFWLSKTELPTNMDLLSNVSFSEDLTVQYTNKPIAFKTKEKYFFDIVIKTGDKEGKFSLAMTNIHIPKFELVNQKFLRSYDSIQSDVMGINKQYTSANENLTVLKNVKPLRDLLGSKENLKRSESFKIPLMPNETTKGLLETCKYEPSYIIKKKLKYKAGVWETRYTSFYPDDGTDMSFYHSELNFLQVSHGNDILDENVAEKIVENMMDAINPRKYKLLSIVNIERVRDNMKGDRFLVELELMHIKRKQISLFSQFVYLPKSGGKLCYPEGFQSNRNAHVNVIVTVKNQGRWIQHLINTFSEIYQSTRDEKYTLIIIDFNSKDIDLKKVLKESFIPNYLLLHHHGKFYKTFGLQEAASKVKNPDEIVLQVDLHLTIPLDFLQVVRKHTVQGKAGFCPSVFRLLCGATPQHPNGYWEPAGYGIFSMYKSDWDFFGGMDVKKFYNHWGGEDWDMLDRFLSAGYEVERQKLKNLNHMYHSKAGMWQNIKD